MKVKRNAILLVLVALLLLPCFVPAQKKKSPKDLPPQYRKWLEEEVVYIISPKERDVFLQLESDRERNNFIEAFWKQRDPTPDTPENEYRTEHYRRIQYVNQWFGRDTPGPGWRTDMGRIYILLGEPKSIDRYETLYDIKPTIIWFYEGMSDYGLPGSFNVVFFKRDPQGEYHLYSPVNDGPQNMLVHYSGDMTDYQSAYEQLWGKEPAVADVSISLIPGETQFSLIPSIASEILIRQRIPQAPIAKVKDDYAEKLLHYKNVIDVDYTTNYIGNESIIRVFQDPGGRSFVHYLIEPSKLTLENVQGRYRTSLEVNGMITGAQGQTVYQFDRKVPLDLDETQLAKIQAKSFSFQDLFPLAPGKYKMSLLWKNNVQKEFTSVEAEILVPEPTAFSMSTPVLAYRIDENSVYKGTNKSFLLGDIQLVPTAGNIFLPGETLYVFFQIHGLAEALKTDGAVEYTILKNGQPVSTSSERLAETPGRTDFFKSFPLAGYTAAHYLLKIAILNPDRTERLSANAPFDITPVTRIVRPWVLSLPLPPTNDPLIANILGGQYLALGDMDKARPLLESAYRRDPATAKYALDFCRALDKTKDYAAVLANARPFLGDDRRFDFLELVGDASKALGQYAEAIAFYKDYLAHFGTNIFVLNGIGNCYVRLGNIAEALVALEKSLELNPNQEDIRALVKNLKEKK